MSKDNGIKVDKTKKSINMYMIVILGMIIVALVGVIIYMAFSKTNNDKNNDNSTTKRNVVVNQENVSQVLDEMNNSDFVPAGSYEVTMNSVWNFEDGRAISDNAYVKNAVTNTNAVYFDVIQSDTKDTLLESPIIPVGAYLENITLDKQLPAGTYDCICTYHLIDDNDKPISEVSLKLTINIRN